MNFLPFSPIPLDHETFVPTGRASALRRFYVAAAAVLVAFLCRLAFQAKLEEALAYSMFNPAILLASVYGGFGPGLFALAAGTLLGDYFFQKPYHSFHIIDGAGLLRLALSVSTGLLICIVGSLLESARRRARSDAQELRRQTAQFRASDESYRRMFETAYEGICCLDEKDRIAYVNGRMVDMLGYSIIGMVGHPVSDFAFEEDLPRLIQVLERRRQGGKDVFDFRLRRKDGSSVYCIISTQSICDREGHYHGQLNMVTDVTARYWSAEDVNRLLDRLKTQVQSLHSLQQTAAAHLGPPADEGPDAVQASDAMSEVRRAINRSMDLSEQIAVLLRTGQTEPSAAFRARTTASSAG